VTDLGQVAQLVAAVALLCNAFATFLAYLQGRRNGEKIEKVRVATDGMKDALVASTAKENFAAGVKEGEENPR
jgi:hypothetical protein